MKKLALLLLFPALAFGADRHGATFTICGTLFLIKYQESKEVKLLTAGIHFLDLADEEVEQNNVSKERLERIATATTNQYYEKTTTDIASVLRVCHKLATEANLYDE